MPIRVISGSAKGRHLKLVPGDSTRPVMDRVKEALFNIIGRDIQDAIWLDLFAGTGSVGIEALSRGARKAVFIELAKPALQTIQANLEVTRLQDRGQVRRADVFEFLRSQSAEAFDFIYIAPPQYKGLWQKTLALLDQNPGWTHQTSTVIVQIDPTEYEPVQLRRLESADQRRYGNTLLWFFNVIPVQSDEEPDSMELKHLEHIAAELLEAFDVSTAPVPIENMLQNPPQGIMVKIDMRDMTTTFLTPGSGPYARRMSLARFLVRQVAPSPWGEERGLGDLIAQEKENVLNTLARMIMMPLDMMEAITVSNRTPMAVGIQFEVPEDDARRRLLDMNIR